MPAGDGAAQPREATDLVCGLTHAFLTGFVASLDAPRVEAVLQPSAGECCVELRLSSQQADLVAG